MGSTNKHANMQNAHASARPAENRVRRARSILSFGGCYFGRRIPCCFECALSKCQILIIIYCIPNYGVFSSTIFWQLIVSLDEAIGGI